MRDAVWLLILASGQSTSEMLQDVHIPLDSRFLVARLWDGKLLLSEVYHISDKLQEVHFGTWSPSNGLHTATRVEFYDRRSNLQQNVIHVSAGQLPVYLIYRTHVHTQSHSAHTIQNCIHIHVRTYIHAHSHTYVQNTHTHTHTHTHTDTDTSSHLCGCLCIIEYRYLKPKTKTIYDAE
jgi:hypothetical protein